MNISKTVLFLLIGTTLFSCRKENSEGINQSEIYTDYRIIYKEDVNTTFVRATFKHEVNTGENLKLGEDASVLANGNAMVWHSSFFRYEHEVSGQDDISLVFTDNEGGKITNSLIFGKIAQYMTQLASNDSLYKDSVQFIPWHNADPLIIGETINLVFIQNSSVVVLLNDTIGATGVWIDKTILNAFQLGDVEAHFEKWTDLKVNTPSAGGISKSQMISETKTVKLLD
jgi:hypothetical protein